MKEVNRSHRRNVCILFFLFLQPFPLVFLEICQNILSIFLLIFCLNIQQPLILKDWKTGHGECSKSCED